ncbi:MAG: hypothetical protein AABX31_04920 [Nanoarchaeota archaeon]
MAIEEVNRIGKIFSELHLHPTYREYEAVITSEDSYCRNEDGVSRS